MTATDEQEKVVWQAEYDAWGKVISPSPFKGEPVIGFPTSIDAKASNADVKGWGGGKSSQTNVSVNVIQNTFYAYMVNSKINPPSITTTIRVITT